MHSERTAGACLRQTCSHLVKMCALRDRSEREKDSHHVTLPVFRSVYTSMLIVNNYAVENMSRLASSKRSLGCLFNGYTVCSIDYWYNTIGIKVQGEKNTGTYGAHKSPWIHTKLNHPGVVAPVTQEDVTPVISKAFETSIISSWITQRWRSLSSLLSLAQGRRSLEFQGLR